MSEKLENPWAFPASGHPGKQFLEQEGMSLRDYFAAAALQGFMASSVEGPAFEDMNEHQKHYADLSYSYADAMLKARGQS